MSSTQIKQVESILMISKTNETVKKMKMSREQLLKDLDNTLDDLERTITEFYPKHKQQSS